MTLDLRVLGGRSVSGQEAPLCLRERQGRLDEHRRETNGELIGLGALPRCVTADGLLGRHNSIPRDPLIAGVFHRTGEKVLEIYAMSIDYDPRVEASQLFFKTIQNKMYWAAHGRSRGRWRGLSDLAKASMVTLPNGEDAAGRQARRFRHFARTRRPVAGPLCLGWGCHFGLGSFVPTPP